MSLQISASGLTKIDRAGRFPLLNPVFDFTYRNPTHALHLYEYHAKVRVNSQEHPVGPGDLTCIQAGSVYSIASETPGKHWCIHFHDAPAAGEQPVTLPGHIRLGGNSLFYREQIQHISHLFRGHGNGPGPEAAELEARFRLKALLLALHGLATGGPQRSGNFSWEELLEWIEENLGSPISVPGLAARVNLAPGTLARKFKQAHKTTLSRHLLHRRIDKARSLLATTTLTIGEVGSRVGIPDPQYFNKQFRKVTGLNPSRYRDENREYLTRIPDQLATREGTWRDTARRAKGAPHLT